MDDKRKLFLACLKPVTAEYVFDPYIILTHASHESGNFKHVIGEFNFWGIKKPHVWNGKTIDIVTHEFIRGIRTRLIDTFIDFATCEQALLWYCDFIKRLYPDAFIQRMNYKEFFKGLTSGKYKYATDPKYSDKLTALYDDVKRNISI